MLEADHLQLAQDQADVGVAGLHQRLQGGLVHCQALLVADLHHALADLLLGRLPAGAIKS